VTASIETIVRIMRDPPIVGEDYSSNSLDDGLTSRYIMNSKNLMLMYK
jgi:hypothetical protein